MTYPLPLIGVTMDAEPPGGYSRYHWYALRANYTAAIAAAGGVPVALPHHPELCDAYLDRIDALVVTGGGFDVDPALYGEGDRHDSVTLKPKRTEAELGLLRGALQRDMPALGICGGQQLMAVASGGTLHQHIPANVPDCLPHEQTTSHHAPAHAISIEPGTLLHRIVRTGQMRVNSSHHQAVASPGAHARVNARAPDGVVEGIEDARYRFCLGVQWHPEFASDPADHLILAALIAAAGS